MRYKIRVEKRMKGTYFQSPMAAHSPNYIIAWDFGQPGWSAAARSIIGYSSRDMAASIVKPVGMRYYLHYQVIVMSTDTNVRE